MTISLTTSDMTKELFHNRSDAGGSQFIATAANAACNGRKILRPSRFAHATRRGVTLVELLVSMLILTIVCIAWLEIIGIQSARKEARRREAVERLSGMMDAFTYRYRNESVGTGVYSMRQDGNTLSFAHGNLDLISPMFDGDVSPIGYQLRVYAKASMPDQSLFSGWDPAPKMNIPPKWLVGRLYDRSDCAVTKAGKPFFTLSVCLGL